jgi:hypothetical protein
VIKEPKNIDFTTTGRQPSEEEFALISAWVTKRKQQLKSRKLRAAKRKKTKIK